MKNQCITLFLAGRCRVALLVFVKYECDIALGHNPENVIDVVRDVRSKLFLDRNADDISNSISYSGFKFFAKNGLSEFSLTVGYGTNNIAVAIQMRIPLVDFRHESFVSDLYEGGATV